MSELKEPLKADEYLLSKREEMAKAALQGLLSSSYSWDLEGAAVEAVKHADRLLEELEKSA